MTTIEQVTYKCVYVWPDGRREVRYIRPVTDKSLLREVEQLRERFGDSCPYEIEL